MISRRIRLCYRVSSGEIMLMKYYCISITEHFTAIFEPKWPKTGYWVRHAIPAYYWKKKKMEGNIFHFISHSKDTYCSNTGAQVSPWILLFCWGREDLVELFLFLAELSYKQHVIFILLNTAAQITLLFSKISNILDTRV